MFHSNSESPCSDSKVAPPWYWQTLRCLRISEHSY